MIHQFYKFRPAPGIDAHDDEYALWEVLLRHEEDKEHQMIMWCALLDNKTVSDARIEIAKEAEEVGMQIVEVKCHGAISVNPGLDQINHARDDELYFFKCELVNRTNLNAEEVEIIHRQSMEAARQANEIDKSGFEDDAHALADEENQQAAESQAAEVGPTTYFEKETGGAK